MKETIRKYHNQIMKREYHAASANQIFVIQSSVNSCFMHDIYFYLYTVNGATYEMTIEYFQNTVKHVKIEY